MTKWKTYQLLFGQQYSASSNFRKPPQMIKNVKPTKHIIKARSRTEAMKKAQKFLQEAEIYGQFNVKIAPESSSS